MVIIIAIFFFFDLNIASFIQIDIIIQNNLLNYYSNWWNSSFHFSCFASMVNSIPLCVMWCMLAFFLEPWDISGEAQIPVFESTFCLDGFYELFIFLGVEGYPSCFSTSCGAWALGFKPHQPPSPYLPIKLKTFLELVELIESLNLRNESEFPTCILYMYYCLQ